MVLIVDVVWEHWNVQHQFPATITKKYWMKQKF